MTTRAQVTLAAATTGTGTVALADATAAASAATGVRCSADGPEIRASALVGLLLESVVGGASAGR